MAAIIIDVPHTPPALAEAKREAIYRGNELQLSARQRAVLIGMFCGKSDREMAQEFSVSLQSIKNRRAEAFHKLGIHSIRELFPLVIMAKREFALQKFCDGVRA